MRHLFILFLGPILKIQDEMKYLEMFAAVIGVTHGIVTGLPEQSCHLIQ